MLLCDPEQSDGQVSAQDSPSRCRDVYSAKCIDSEVHEKYTRTLVSARSVNFSFRVIIISSVKISVRQPVQLARGHNGAKPRILDIAGYVRVCQLLYCHCWLVTNRR